MDCHALMFKLAGEMMQAQGFDFLYSGEVVGQRPMSQTKSALRYVEKHSGFEGYILRPLSAKNLPQTIPEKEGLVNRELLLDIEGRSRKRQIQLAKKFGIAEYPTPAGGCLLTDQGYSNRLKDLFDHQSDSTEAELHLLKYGRHFRLNPEAKLIVGRTERDNENILNHHDPSVDTVIRVKKFPGPIALVPYGAKKDSIFLAASICAGYSKAPNFSSVKVQVTSPRGKEVIKVLGLPPEDVKKLMIT
jgi:tRNA U34 2-thiouridine synthase MnmA/TrmU